MFCSLSPHRTLRSSLLTRAHLMGKRPLLYPKMSSHPELPWGFHQGFREVETVLSHRLCVFNACQNSKGQLEGEEVDCGTKKVEAGVGTKLSSLSCYQKKAMSSSPWCRQHHGVPVCQAVLLSAGDTEKQRKDRR